MKSLAYIAIALAGSASAQSEEGRVSIPGGETPTGGVSIPGGETPSGTPTLTLTIPTGEPSDPPATGCPTVTVTGELCSTCAVPACLKYTTATQQCGCSEEVPTVTIDFSCEKGCAGAGCATEWEVVAATETCDGGGGDGGDGDGGDGGGGGDGDGGDGGDGDGNDGGSGGDGGSGDGPQTGAAGRLLPFWAFWL